MAIYHLTVKTGTRKEGQSAGVKSDYINRDGRYDRDDLVHAASGNMPVWAMNPGAYWAAADVYERVNGRLYKEIEGALPRELSRDQQRKLVEAFVRAVVELERLPYSLALHSGEDESGEGNPHFHLMVSERMNDNIPRSAGQWFKRYSPKNPAKGGARKTESLKPQAWLEQTRKLWADLANAALERAGHDARIDHRTLEAQGVARVPQIHQGPNVRAMKDKGIQTDRGDRYREIEEVNEQIALLQAQRVRVDRELAESEAEVESELEDLMVAKKREIDVMVERQALEDEDRQRFEQAQIWGATPGGIPSDESVAEAGLFERYGVTMWVAPGSVTVQPDQQTKTPRQIAAALYRQCRDHAQHEGWAAIEFFGVSFEARAEIERMAAVDRWSDRIQFREDNDNAAGPGDGLDVDLDAEMNRPLRNSGPSGPKMGGP